MHYEQFFQKAKVSITETDLAQSAAATWGEV